MQDAGGFGGELPAHFEQRCDIVIGNIQRGADGGPKALGSRTAKIVRGEGPARRKCSIELDSAKQVSFGCGVILAIFRDLGALKPDGRVQGIQFDGAFDSSGGRGWAYVGKTQVVFGVVGRQPYRALDGGGRVVSREVVCDRQTH